MVQILKDTVRTQILSAARERFAKVGFKKATMGDIASEAGVATGTIYKYFKNKNRLFGAIITDSLVDAYLRLTQNRIASFARKDGPLSPDNKTQVASGELLQFYVDNRLEIIIILSRAQGTKYESFAREYVQSMESQSIRQAQKQFPEMTLSPTFHFMVKNILEESVRFLVSALETFTEAESIMKALSAMTAYQLAGINALIDWAHKDGKENDRI
ncbi:TetR/AcrR family transcriptional regulator [Pseudodesulfovibrio cashew]|nr:TetR/AcrR family transcriptional regulator [Pseudodesulfovibrio cashew]